MNIVKVDVDNPTELLAAFGAGALVNLEFSATGGGVGFSSVGSQTLVAQTTQYTFNHTAGSVGTWYRARYSNVGATQFSDYGPEFRIATSRIMYASVDDLIKRLPAIPSTGVRNQEQLADYIADASAEITSNCGRSFGRFAETRYFNGPERNRDRLVVVAGIVSVSEVAWTDLPGGTFTPLLSTDWTLGPDQREPDDSYYIIQLLPTSGISAFYRGISTIRVTGVFGYDTVPDIIKRGTLALARQYWATRPTAAGQATADPEFAGQIIPSMYPRVTYDAITWGRSRVPKGEWM